MTPLPNHWPALVAGARVAYVPFNQRAYKDSAGWVRFYPSHQMRDCDGEWYPTVWPEGLRRAKRLPDAEAAALWATRPEGAR